MTDAERRAKRNARQKEYYRKNRARVLELKYLKDAKDIQRTRDLQAQSALKRLAWFKTEIYKKYGDRCARCGFDDPRAFQIDHVNGGGTKDVRQHASRWAYLKAVLADTSGKFQVLCANCNQIKRVELGEHRRGYTRHMPKLLGGAPLARAIG